MVETDGTVFLNGSYVPAQKAVVSVYDLAF